MSGKRAKQLREQARIASLDGSVIGSHEYRRLKRSYHNPHYALVVILHPSPPGLQFTGPYRLLRMKKKKDAARKAA